VITLEILSRVI